VYVPRDKDCFKLRSNVEKCVVVTLCQITDNLSTLNIERCFGMLVSPGRNVRHSDMQLLEGVKMSQANMFWRLVHTRILGPQRSGIRSVEPGDRARHSECVYDSSGRSCNKPDC